MSDITFTLLIFFSFLFAMKYGSKSVSRNFCQILKRKSSILFGLSLVTILLWLRKEGGKFSSIANNATYRDSPGASNIRFSKRIDDPVVRKWADPDCYKFTTQFAQRASLPLIALASYPDSGAELLRYVVEGTTGVFTGSFHENLNEPEDFPGDQRNFSDGSTISQMTFHHMHKDADKKTEEWRANHVETTFEGTGILLIRDPFQVLMSRWNRLVDENPTTFYSQRKFEEFALSECHEWFNLIHDWVKNSKKLHVIMFEELLSNSKRVMEDLVKFLKVKHPHQDRVDRIRCTIGHLGSLTPPEYDRPKGSIKLTDHVLKMIRSVSDAVNEKLNAKIGRVMPLVYHKGYFMDPDWEED